MKRKWYCWALWLCMPLLTWSAPFQANERVAFIGDSITHGGRYHTYIQTFYATRFPDRNVVCFNVGISGDTAHGGYQRASAEGDGIWENDVSVYRPTAATVMLGMNDVGGGHFLSSETREALITQNNKQLEWYRHNYATLLDNLAKQGLDRITLIKSSPYDQTMVNSKAKDNLRQFGLGKNDAIVSLGAAVIDVESAKRGYSVCDFNTAMLDINAVQQKTDPTFSIIGLDRVHPGDDGHMVMAYTFLKYQALEGPVAEIALYPANASQASMLRKEKKLPCTFRNCTVSNLKMSIDGVSFDYQAKALPFPRSLYNNVADLIPFEQEFNREMLTAPDLEQGTYLLSIDGLDMAQFSQDQLVEGINMALLDKAPQVIQANEVLKLCRERAALAGKIRAVVWSVGYLGKIKGHDATDTAANKAMAVRILDGYVPEGLWARAYEKGLVKQYLENVDRYTGLLDELDSMTAPIYEATRPRMHRIELKKVN